MKTRDFISECANGSQKKPRDAWKKVSSVAWDGSIIYSYGPHYPLLFPLKDSRDSKGFVWVLNDAGYSVTTSKHIGNAGQWAAFRVKMPRLSSFASDVRYWVSPAGIIEAANGETRANEAEIERAIESQLKRPRYAPVYQRTIDALEERNAQLKRLINAAELAKKL